MNNKKSTLLFCAGLIPLFIVIANMALWMITATGNDITFEQMVANYLSHYPEWLQNARLLTIINIVLLGIAGGLFFLSTRNPKLKIVGPSFAILSGILGMWNVFSLM